MPCGIISSDETYEISKIVFHAPDDGITSDSEDTDSIRVIGWISVPWLTFQSSQ